MGQPAQHRNIDRAPETKHIFDAEHDHREDIERVEIGPVASGNLVDRLGGEGDGVEEDEDDDKGVDRAAGGVRVAADFENVVNLTPPAPPDCLCRHSLGASRATGLRALRRGTAFAGDPRRNRVERLLGAGAVGASGLGQIGPSAPAFPAEDFRADPDQLHGVVGRGEICGHADHEPGLALLTHADDGDDARPQLPFAVVDQAAQILGGDALHRPRQ